MIKRGAADAVLAGGTEACLIPLILAGFTAMRGLAAENDDPTHASRPFDATRAGFVMSEGAGALLLEDWDGAPSGAEPTSTRRCSATARRTTRTTWPSPSRRRRGSAAMMRACARPRRGRPGRVGYINAHGTVHAARGRRRDTRDQAGLRRARVRARGLVDEVDDGPHVRSGRRDRGDHVRAGVARR